MEEIKNLIAVGKLEKAINQLLVLSESTDMHNSIILQSARLNEIIKSEKMGIIRSDEASRSKNQITYALLSYIDDLEDVIDNDKAGSPSLKNQKRTIFISYNHKDEGVAKNVKFKLEKAGFMVTIDSEAMHAGEDIQQFIEKCVKENDITLSLVSSNSLLSAWVAMESALAFSGERMSNKRFIPCAIDGEFFSRSFVDNALDVVDREIEELDSIIEKRRLKKRGIEDLQNELTRYNHLKNNLPEIVRRLKESLTVNISGELFKKGMDKVIDELYNNQKLQ